MKLFNFTKLNALCLSILLLTVYLIFFYYAEKKIYTKEKFTHKKIMFLVSTETFGGKGVYTMYNEMKRVGYDVKIVIVPHPHPNIQGGIDTKFIDKFNSQDVVYPCGKYDSYSNINIKCEIESLKNYQPDFIIQLMVQTSTFRWRNFSLNKS